MAAWLLPSIIATLAASFCIEAAYVYIYLQERDAYLRTLSLAWLGYILRFSAMLAGVLHPGRALWMILAWGFTLINSGLLLVGIRQFFTRKTPGILLGTLLLFLFGLLFVPISEAVKVAGVFFLSGAVFLYCGLLFLTNRKGEGALRFFIAVVFILWGLHKWDYPFLRFNQGLAPAGYLLGSLLTFMAAFSILLLHYRSALLRSRNEARRIHSLYQLYQHRSDGAQALLCRVMETASRWTAADRVHYGFHRDQGDRAGLPSRLELKSGGGACDAAGEAMPFLCDGMAAGSLRKGETWSGQRAGRYILAVPLQLGGEWTGTLCLQRDRSPFESRESQFCEILNHTAGQILEQRDYLSRLKAQKEEAEEANRIKDAFLANMSHELRTPLNGMIGMLALIDEESLEAGQRHFLDLARKSSDDMLAVTENLLTLSALQKDKLTLDWQPFDAALESRPLLRRFSELAGERGLRFSQRIEPDSIPCYTDRVRFYQILSNLFSNALKYTDRGEIAVSLTGDEERLKLAVRDQGVGIAENDMERIFDPLSQLEDPYTKEHRGIGAGMSIVKALVERLGGEITVESEVNRGSCFTVVLPRGDRRKRGGADNPAVHKAPPSPAEPVKHILIVEDEAVNRLYLEEILRNAAYRVMVAEDGEEAVRLAAESSPDLVFMDISLPRMSGMEAAEEIRKLSGLSRVPIIALTAHAEEEQKERFLAAGLDMVIEKPFSVEELLEAIALYGHGEAPPK